MSDTPQDPKARVLVKFPEAHTQRGIWNGWFIISQPGRQGKTLGYGETEAEAWDDAAKRLDGE